MRHAMSSDDEDYLSLLAEAQCEIDVETEAIEDSILPSPVHHRGFKRFRPSIASASLPVSSNIDDDRAQQPNDVPMGAQSEGSAGGQGDGDQDFDENINRQFNDLPSEWADRCERQHGFTVFNRPFLFHAAVCTAAIPAEGTLCNVCCKAHAVLRCLDCSFAAKYLLCGNCDVATHPYAHFHRRECWDQGFWEPIPPLLSIDQYGQPYDRGLCLNIQPRRCLWNDCQSEHFSSPVASTEKITYVLHGRHEFMRGTCTCLECGKIHKANILDFVALGAWPCTPNVERCSTFVDQRVLQHYAASKHRAPSFSAQAFLRGLAVTSRPYGGTGQSINQDTFTDCYLEWRYKEGDRRLYRDSE